MGEYFFFFWRTKGEIQKRVKRERSKAEGYNRKASLKEEVLSCGLTLLNNYVLRSVSTPSTLMPTGMGVTNPKFSKSARKPKKTEYCTIPKWWQRKSSNS